MMHKNFIEAFELKTSERFSINEKTRAVILTVDDFAPAAEFCQWLAMSDVPTILAVKKRASIDLVSAAHLCVAGSDAEIGNFPACEALKRGLINKVAESIEKLEQEARALAEKIVTLAPLAIRADLRAVAEGFDMPLDEALRLETELFAPLFATEDAREGTQAFLEKRKPVFRGE